LELIRSLITLNEIRSVPEQVAKLRPVSSELKLSLLLNALESGQFTEALAQIEEYLVRSTALTRAGETEIPQLRLRLTGLELRLEALNNEKAELDRRLLIFGRHHDETLGDLIQEVLQARAELAGLRASQAQKGDASKAQEEADEANRKYSEYSEHRQSILENEPPPVLDKKSEKELKRAYRQACQLCHPDKVQEEYKERAQATFVELQNAYRLNDLAKVKEILETLQGGAFPAFRSALLRTFDALKSAIAEIEYKIGAVVNDIVLLRESNSYQLMIKFGSSAERWRAYVKDQRVLLSDELNELRASIAAEDE
jgi:hypothetical protein